MRWKEQVAILVGERSSHVWRIGNTEEVGRGRKWQKKEDSCSPGGRNSARFFFDRRKKTIRQKQERGRVWGKRSSLASYLSLYQKSPGIFPCSMNRARGLLLLTLILGHLLRLSLPPSFCSRSGPEVPINVVFFVSFHVNFKPKFFLRWVGISGINFSSIFP